MYIVRVQAVDEQQAGDQVVGGQAVQRWLGPPGRRLSPAIRVEAAP